MGAIISHGINLTACGSSCDQRCLLLTLQVENPCPEGLKPTVPDCLRCWRLLRTTDLYFADRPTTSMVVEPRNVEFAHTWNSYRPGSPI